MPKFDPDLDWDQRPPDPDEGDEDDAQEVAALGYTDGVIKTCQAVLMMLGRGEEPEVALRKLREALAATIDRMEAEKDAQLQGGTEPRDSE